jgi:Flp pilus assembly protein TadB
LKADDKIKDILKRYERKLGKKVSLPTEYYPGEKFSRQYETFRKEALEKTVTRYESWCNFAEKLIKLKASEKDRVKIEKAIDDAHVNVSVGGALSFAVMVGILIIVFGILFLALTFMFGKTMVFLPLMFVLAGGLIIKPLSRYPVRLANLWRVRASNQMVLCILYIVMYMRHTSNLERAIKFAGEHIGGPLALDLRKVFWNIEVGKYVTIQESLEVYLERWKDTNLEFVEAFHLIESSLYENYDARRLDLLEKALEIELEGTYEKMLHYAHDLKSPITMLYMLGVILPVLGLVIFPMLASFMQGLVKWYHISVLYNIFLPVFVLFFGYNLLVKRPSGYGESQALKKTIKEAKGLRSTAIFIGFVIVLIGFLPIILHFATPQLDTVGFFKGTVLEGKLLDYKCGDTGCVGPYGVFSLILSLLIPLGIAIGFSFYYKMKTKGLMKIRNRTKILEKEFSGALFQLGNRIAKGIPVEIAFGKVATTLKGTPIGQFFSMVSTNIRSAGMDVKRAIFDPGRGAILFYPSALIEGSMKVLIESARKGPKVVAKSLLTISDYSKRVHDIDERLRDLLADVISSMRSQITFLTPMIAGIVVAVGSMIVTIVNKLSEQFAGVGMEGAEGLGAVANLASFIKVTDVIPSFHFQLVVGLYLVEITFILTILSNGIEKGVDKISEQHDLSRNLLVSTVLYVLIALVGIIIFNVLAGGLVTVSTAL